MTTEPLQYRCRSCGETHVGLPAWHFDTPIQVLGIPPAERERDVELTSDGCVIDAPDGRWFFVKGLLEIPVQGVEQPFTWGVWVSLSEESFARYVELYNDRDRQAGEAFFGWLCNRLPDYPETQELKTRLHVRAYPLRPTVELEPIEHPLAVDQREGIARERAIQLAERLLHSPEGA